jgi:hypothetical protein
MKTTILRIGLMALPFAVSIALSVLYLTMFGHVPSVDI